jgi:hypothetical protein
MDMFKPALLAIALVASLAASNQAEQPQPVPPNVVGTIGLDGTIEKFYSETRTAIVKTADGLLHLVHLTDRTAVHGGASEDPFYGLNEGSRVVVHYVAEGSKRTAVEIDRVGNGALQVAEGVIVCLDRPARKLVVQLPDDSWVTLRLTDRAAHSVGKEFATRTRVVVYYAEEGGAQAAHYFRKVE